jgi:hypothetical protein
MLYLLFPVHCYETDWGTVLQAVLTVIDSKMDYGSLHSEVQTIINTV